MTATDYVTMSPADRAAVAEVETARRARIAEALKAQPLDPGTDEEPFSFDVLTMATLAARVDNAPPPRWLARGLIARGDYGIAGAAPKVGKSWASLDLAVAVASGGAWLGTYEVEEAGAVVIFLGEGGERKTLRRLRAVATSKGVDLDACPVHLVTRVPHLSNAGHLDGVAAVLADHAPALVIIDPLYLAARGTNASQLNEVGAALEGVQHLCQEHGAALLIVHHYNRATGSGAARLSGAGPTEWGRFLIAMEKVAEVVAEDGASVATITVEVTGDEMAPARFTMRRTVAVLGDPTDLGSPMRYEVEMVEGGDPTAEGPLAAFSPAARRVYAVLDAATDWLKVAEVGDRLADAGAPLKKRTINDALKRLRDAGLAEPFGTDGSNEAWSWRIVRPPSW